MAEIRAHSRNNRNTYKSYCGLQFSCKFFLWERQFDHLSWRATRGKTRGWRKIWERGGCVCVCVCEVHGGVWTMLCNICPVPCIPIGLLEDTLYNLNRGKHASVVSWLHNDKFLEAVGCLWRRSWKASARFCPSWRPPDRCARLTYCSFYSPDMMMMMMVMVMTPG